LPSSACNWFVSITSVFDDFLIPFYGIME